MKKYKVGILTYHRAINYGAFLQAYALCSRLNSEEDIEAEIIDFRMKREEAYYSCKLTKSKIKHPIRTYYELRTINAERESFARDYPFLPLSEQRLISDDNEAFASFVRNRYDVVIAGSDEIWKTNGLRGFPTPYWLPGDIQCRKIAYAASARNRLSEMEPEKQKMIRALLRDFEFIGVRDQVTKSEIDKFAEKEAVLCCDPSFLWEFEPNVENGMAIIRRRVKSGKKVLAIMSEDLTVSKILPKKLSDDYEVLSLYHHQPGSIDLTDLSPFEWVDVLASVDLLITSYFHAVCFAEKFGTPLIAVGTPAKLSKVQEVLSDIHREDDLVRNFHSMAKDGSLMELIYDKVRNKPQCVHASRDMLNGYEKMLDVIRNG